MTLRAMFWWIDRWRASSAFANLTLEEQGAYRNMLDDAQLRGGAIPDNDRALMLACGDPVAWPRLRDRMLARFYLTDDGWRNETLDTVLGESKRRAEKQRRYRDRQGAPAVAAPASKPAPVKRAPESNKTAFVGKRFQVWTWQHDEFVRALGAKPFDLLGWYPKLDEEMIKSGAPIADEPKWLRERFYLAAGINRPNLFGRQAPAGTEPCAAKHNPPCATPADCIKRQRAERG